ncbi:MAG: dynamin family protein [Marinibacterium sp.]
MASDIQSSDPNGAAPHKTSDLIASTFARLENLGERLNALDKAALDLSRSKDRAISAEARRIRKQIRDFEPSVTMIGQVKAGKTTLVNAMAGQPGVLPSDVNPWTSVVTSLHLIRGMAPGLGRASFRFFSEDEWTHLVQRGGRVGELASRAGAADEMEKVRAQLEEMRNKSRERLGRRFEMLLGQSHDYDRADGGLIERYVCLGDDFWDAADGSSDQGRFADITKSADLWFGRPELPLSLCIRDTPGVNDTFMIREQITINALRGSRLCVVVLSAHQALSSVDLALVRMISNVKARDVVIFVNRIDELSDPAREVPEIRASILDTLKKFDGPTDSQILFGSAFWAGHALTGTYEEMGVDSAQALLTWAEAPENADIPRQSLEDMVWHLSGLPALGHAIASRIESGLGAKFEDLIDRAVGNLRQTAKLSQSPAPGAAKPVPDGAREFLPPEDFQRRLDQIARTAYDSFDQDLQTVRAGFLDRIDKSRQAFLGRATASLIKHLENYGEQEIWTYDPSGLRILLRSSYQVFARSASRIGEDVLGQTAGAYSALYRQAFQLGDGEFSLEPPPTPPTLAPVVLGQTIALDLSGNWWTRFWRKRRGYQAFVDDFAKLIHEETAPIIDALKMDNADAFEHTMREQLRDFIDSQRAIFTDLAAGREVNLAALNKRDDPTIPSGPEPAKPKIVPVAPRAVGQA